MITAEHTEETDTIPCEKVYREKAIQVATFIGGPLVAGYMIAENYRSFSESDKSTKAWFYAIFATVVLFGGALMLPDSVNIPNYIFPIFYCWITYYLVKYYQGEQISTHIKAGGKTHNWSRVFCIGLIGAVVTALPILGVAYIADTAEEDTIKIYGSMKHEIVFNKNNISESEVDNIADAFTKTTFFDDAVTKYTYAKKIGSSYEISISCDKSVVETPDNLTAFVQLHNDMQSLFPHNKIIFNLVVDNLDNVVKRLE